MRVNINTCILKYLSFDCYSSLYRSLHILQHYLYYLIFTVIVLYPL